jgi:molybdate transport system substrate-binding protein
LRRFAPVFRYIRVVRAFLDHSGAVPVILAAIVLSFGGAALGETGPSIAAASDLKFALDDIAARFERDTGKTVRLTYGSSGNFYRQIQQGAPFELFLSADEEYVSRLAQEGLTVDGGIRYATGRIVLFVPKGSTVKADPAFADLRAAVNDGRLRRLAIANPEHAPYGRAARQTLEHEGLWKSLSARLVLGENVAQAAQFALSGSAQAGIFALSLALSPDFAGKGDYVLIPESRHEPLRQRAVLLRRSGETARAFLLFLQQPAAQEVFRRYGYMLPGD